MYIFVLILTLIIGGVIGFFGVLVSVFADGNILERLITICVILLIYGLLSGILGYIMPRYSWKWGLLLGSPAVLFLALYLLKETSSAYFLYMFLIIGISCLSALLGSFLKNRIKNRRRT